MGQTDNEALIDNKVNEEIKEPGMFNVIMLNDDYTPMDFVVGVLITIFNKNEKEAYDLMMKVHKKGSAVAGTYIEDIALTKSESAKNIARKNGFPFTTKVKPA